MIFFIFNYIHILKKYCNNILYGEFEMKKEKNIQDEEKKIVEVIETENFEVSKSGSLKDDLMQFENINDIKIENQEVPDIEVQEIYIRETGNYLNLQ